MWKNTKIPFFFPSFFFKFWAAVGVNRTGLPNQYGHTHAATATIITLQGFLLKMATDNLVLELHAGTVEQRG